MPLGGKLVLKGGETLGGVEKKKKKKAKKAPEEGALEGAAEGAQPAEGAGADQPSGSGQQPAATKKIEPQSIAVGGSGKGKTYEEEFEYETQRMKAPKVKNTPWGSTYRAAPEILHGYTTKVKGKTAEERLDMRSATKSDKFCK